MTKLSIAATALALAVSAVPFALTTAQAAPSNNPYCANKWEKWNMGWQQYYHCFGTEPRAARIVHHVATPKSPYCNNRFEKWNLGWEQYYHCYGS